MKLSVLHLTLLFPVIPLIPLKISENIWFSYFFQGGQKGTLERKRLIKKLFINFEKSELIYFKGSIVKINVCKNFGSHFHWEKDLK